MLRAYALSRNVTLADRDAAKETRALYPPPAGRPPSVIRCDTASGDTWFSGRHLGERAEAWTRLLTDSDPGRRVLIGAQESPRGGPARERHAQAQRRGADP